MAEFVISLQFIWIMKNKLFFNPAFSIQKILVIDY